MTSSPGAADTGPAGFSVYVHVPFCSQKCHYCDFYTVTDPQGRDPLRAKWLDLCLAELELLATRRPPFAVGATPLAGPVRTVFFGGGTPSLLPPADFARFLRGVHDRFELLPDAEITLETQPGTIAAVTSAYDGPAAYVAAGINRFSVGVQTFDEALLAATGRRHTSADSLAAIHGAAATGAAVSVDLIAALPGQTLARWDADLDMLLRLAAALPALGHVSTYELTIHPATRWARDRAAGLLREAPEDDRVAMFRTAERRLTAAGFDHYEISNHARPGCRSLHNQAYWRLADVIGLGAGAHSTMWPRRWRNPDAARPWAAAIADGRLPALPAETDDPDVFVAENLAMAIRLLDGFDLDWFAAKTGTDLRAGRRARPLSRLVEDGIVVIDGANLRLTPEGRLAGDTVSDRLL